MSNTAHNDLLAIDQTPVGELLGAELELRGWSQADFAAVIDRPTQFVSEIVTGKKEITLRVGRSDWRCSRPLAGVLAQAAGPVFLGPTSKEPDDAGETR